MHIAHTVRLFLVSTSCRRAECEPDCRCEQGSAPRGSPQFEKNSTANGERAKKKCSVGSEETRLAFASLASFSPLPFPDSQCFACHPCPRTILDSTLHLEEQNRAELESSKRRAHYELRHFTAALKVAGSGSRCVLPELALFVSVTSLFLPRSRSIRFFLPSRPAYLAKQRESMRSFN